MAAGRVHNIVRMLFALVLGGFVALGALPDSVWDGIGGEHARDHDHSDGSHAPILAALNDLEICHAGLDCITVAIVEKSRVLPVPKQASMILSQRFERLERDSWMPQLDVPPPRFQS
ncbi:hypothetical protein LCL97_11280 [Seohaeicola saemankumensis]|nr:hypothetical protein [Seohaeicola saemankumensis]MCA0871410.1 hypothetical protein [Seohaeicola saemankumensis]